MIDLHSHVLPGLDDGAKTFEESVQMCWISFKDGIRTIVATPHTLNDVYLNDRGTILAKVRELNEALKKFGMRDAGCGVDDVQSEICNLKSGVFLHSALRALNSELKIVPGADVRLCETTLPYLEQGKVTTVGDNGKYVFIEFPFQGIPYWTGEILFGLMKRGVTPIITHPERNLEVLRKPERYYEMIRAGCLGQVTAMSLTGGFGPEVRRVAEKLLANRLIHFIASDAHSIHGRPPILSQAVKIAERIINREEAWKMVKEYPRAILEGRKPDVPDPIPIR